MKLLSALLALTPALAFGQVSVEFSLPTIRFEVPPPVVVVTPGVQVVEDYEEEVFFVDGHYWSHRDGRWFRARDHRGGWVVVEHRYVPERIVTIPRGKYRRYKRHHDKHHHHDDDRRYKRRRDRDRDHDHGRHHDVKRAGHKDKKHKHKHRNKHDD